jgi:hypothetical protein
MPQPSQDLHVPAKRKSHAPAQANHQRWRRARDAGGRWRTEGRVVFRCVCGDTKRRVEGVGWHVFLRILSPIRAVRATTFSGTPWKSGWQAKLCLFLVKCMSAARRSFCPSSRPHSSDLERSTNTPDRILTSKAHVHARKQQCTRHVFQHT